MENSMDGWLVVTFVAGLVLGIALRVLHDEYFFARDWVDATRPAARPAPPRVIAPPEPIAAVPITDPDFVGPPRPRVRQQWELELELAMKHMLAAGVPPGAVIASMAVVAVYGLARLRR